MKDLASGDRIMARNNVSVTGTGARTLVLAHGFGCDQRMWRFLIPLLEDRFRVVTFDYVGCGASDPDAFDAARYGRLEGYAEDILEVCAALGLRDTVLIGHSVSAMTGLIAAIKAPEVISKLVMVCPSPCFLNDPPGYHGGFETEDLEEMMRLMAQNYAGWANHLAPLVMGPQAVDLAKELAESFCATRPDFAQIFARATFFADCRALLGTAPQETLVLQSSDDALVDVSVGRFITQRMPHARMEVVPAEGHALHMTHAPLIAPMITRFLDA